MKTYISHTEEQFNKYPSVSKAQQIESLVDGVSIDYGYNYSVSGEKHEELLKDNGEVY